MGEEYGEEEMNEYGDEGGEEEMSEGSDPD
jgi:hypothetical protein